MESKAVFFRDSFGHSGQIHLFRIGDRSTRTTRVFGCKGHNECDVGHANLNSGSCWGIHSRELTHPTDSQRKIKKKNIFKRDV